VLVAPDPRAVSHDAGYDLTASDDVLTARALVGGPRMAIGSIQVSARVTGGLALIAQQLGPGRALVAHLQPGHEAAIERIADGTATTLCTGMIPEFPPDPMAVRASLTVTASSITASVDDLVVASCPRDPHADDRGSWGMAPDGTGAKITVFSATATRKTP
jgi:hypothetical protein